MTELIQAAVPTTLVQNQVYALPAKSCLMFCSTAGAGFQQSNSLAFTDFQVVQLVLGEAIVSGTFIRSVNGDALVMLRTIASGSFYLAPGFVPGLWDDLNVIPAAGINPNGPDNPATVINDPAGYFGCLQFDAIGESSFVAFQIPHTYLLGTDIHPHIHVVRNDAVDNTGDVEFTANFRVLQLIGNVFAWTGMTAGDKTLQPVNGADKTGLIEWELSNAVYNFNISYIILMAIRRSGLATGSVAVTSADIHGQKGQFGSVNEGSL